MTGERRDNAARFRVDLSLPFCSLFLWQPLPRQPRSPALLYATALRGVPAHPLKTRCQSGSAPLDVASPCLGAVFLAKNHVLITGWLD